MIPDKIIVFIQNGIKIMGENSIHPDINHPATTEGKNRIRGPKSNILLASDSLDMGSRLDNTMNIFIAIRAE